MLALYEPGAVLVARRKARYLACRHSRRLHFFSPVELA